MVTSFNKLGFDISIDIFPGAYHNFDDPAWDSKPQFQPMAWYVTDKCKLWIAKDYTRSWRLNDMRIELDNYPKSNYNLIAEDISWLRKDSIPVPTTDGLTESTGIYFTTDLNKVTKAKNKLKAAQNLNWCKAQLPVIQKLMAEAKDDTITLNSIVLELLPLDPDHADEKIPEATIKTRIRRKLENGFSGREETKDGYERTGIEWSDGYNYWLRRDHSKSGAASVFITRAVDFKRKNKR